MFEKAELFLKEHKTQIRVVVICATFVACAALVGYTQGVMDGVRVARPTIVS